MSTESNATPKILPFTIHAQYIKDLSFENPNPIASFTNETNEQPNISVGVQAKADHLGGANFEVVLDIRVDANRDKKTLFVMELSYAGIVTVADTLNKEEVGALLMVESPSLLFPFARNILADITQQGGFPPLMLAAVDFATLYEKQKEQVISERKGKKNKPKK
jgi:preprotein translocase subunit SecB